MKVVSELSLLIYYVRFNNKLAISSITYYLKMLKDFYPITIVNLIINNYIYIVIDIYQQVTN